MRIRQLVGRLAWATANPRPALEGLVGRLKYPSYKYQVGPPELYETLGLHQFELLRSWGLRPHHFLLDIGCGSLRAGQFFVPYLEARNYFGIEPNRSLVEEGVKHNLGKTLLESKRPTFRYDADFNLSALGRTFDFLLAHSILTHAPQHLIRKCFTEARKVMSSTSLFFATYNRGETDYTGVKWVAPGVDFDGGCHGEVIYTRARIAALAEEAGLQCAELDVAHPARSCWIRICRSDSPIGLLSAAGQHRSIDNKP